MNLKIELENLTSKGQKEGITLLEFDQAKNKFLNDFIENTPDKKLKASDLVQQYRDNNTALSEAYEPGKSFAYNRAKRDAILEYNRVIAGMIEKEFPDTAFANLFKETNKKWSEIMDSEAISKFLDNAFNEKTDFKQVKKIFDKEGMNVPFKRAMGEEGYAKFERLLKDLLSTEEANKLLKVAQGKGMGDLVSTVGSYFLHPNIAKGKFAFDAIKGGYRKIYDMLLDKPQLAVTWDRGINALKRGEFKVAEKELGKIKEAEKAFEAQETARRSALKKFNEKKSSFSYENKFNRDSRLYELDLKKSDGKSIGQIKYKKPSPDLLEIESIQTDPNMQTKGLSVDLMSHLLELHPEVKQIETSALTKQGASVASKMIGKPVRKQIEKIEDPISMYDQKSKFDQNDIQKFKEFSKKRNSVETKIEKPVETIDNKTNVPESSAKSIESGEPIDNILKEALPKEKKTKAQNPLINPKEDVRWHMSQEKRPFATSTKATSDGIEALIKKGDTFNDIYKKINYDPKAKSIIKHYIDNGYGDTVIPLTKDGRIAPLPSSKKTALQEFKDLDAPLKEAHQKRDKVAIDKIMKRRNKLLEHDEVLDYITKKSNDTSGMSSKLPKPTKGNLEYTPRGGKTIIEPSEIYDGVFSITKRDGDYVVSHIPTGASLATYKTKKSALQLMKDLFEDDLIDPKYVRLNTMEEAGKMFKNRNDLIEKVRKYS